jgi:predicted phosphodiesterase
VKGYGRQKWQFTRHCNSWNGITPETVKIPYRESKNPGVKVHHYGQVRTEDIAELIAWYVTKGCSRKACTTISQYQTVNPQNHQQIINLMSRIGGKFTRHNKGIRIHSMELAEWLTTTCGSGSRNKYLPTWLKECDTDILQLVLDTMIKGDGWEMGVSWGYRSISPQLLNDFVEIAIKCGYGVTFVKGNETVTITKCQHEPTVTSHPKELHYEGKIYCCEVPNGLILVQRNGKTLWTHNSYAISYRLQKLVESFSGGKKPNILFGGHVHKQGYFQIRNIQCFGAGCIQAQSAWMRSKRLSAETGFWVVRLKINNRGISRVQSEWFPFYL